MKAVTQEGSKSSPWLKQPGTKKVELGKRVNASEVTKLRTQMTVSESRKPQKRPALRDFVTEEDNTASDFVEFVGFTPKNIGLHKKLQISFAQKRSKIISCMAKTRKRIREEELMRVQVQEKAKIDNLQKMLQLEAAKDKVEKDYYEELAR